MGLPTGSSHFQTLFDAALQDYEKQTGTKLAEHPLAKEFETCDSVESVTAVLQKEAQGVSKFRGEDSKAMKSLKRGVHVLFMLSASTALGEGVGTVRREPEGSHGPGVYFWFPVFISSCTGLPTRDGDLRWPRYTAFRTRLSPLLHTGLCDI
jgi:hypothetical protein